VDKDLAELLEGALPGAPPSVPAPVTGRPFKSWHLPRKQYVRIKQWCALVREHLRKVRLPSGSSFRYLTLPGDDLLDIRALHSVFECENAQIRFLGYNAVTKGSIAESALTLAESEVLAMPAVDRTSKVKRERIESIAVSGAVAALTMSGEIPFDAVNLDLCQSLLPANDGVPIYIGLLATIVDLQRQYAVRPWLMFVTTRIQRDRIGTETWQALAASVNKNLDIQEFRGAFEDLFPGLKDGPVTQAYIDELEPIDYTALSCLSITKWLLCFLEAAQPRWSVRLRDCVFYSVVPGEPDLLSIALEFVRDEQPGSDFTGLLPRLTPADCVSSSESIDALTSLRKLEDLKDVDKYLCQNPVEFEKYKRQSRTLLQQAHYDLAEYDTFVERSTSQRRVT
jgi:hypothetical protein